MAEAVRNHRRNRTSKEIAYHVIEVFEAIEKSSMEGKVIGIESSFSIPGDFESLGE